MEKLFALWDKFILKIKEKTAAFILKTKEAAKKLYANKKLFVAVLCGSFLLLAGLVFLIVCLCSDSEPIPVTPEPVASETVASEPVASETLPQPTAETFISELTGLEKEGRSDNQRPVAVMICNEKGGVPQRGISAADIIFEYPHEGGDTRFLAVFENTSVIPVIGTVRSSRDYYIDIAKMFDALYVHLGGSPQAYRQLKTRDIDSYDGITQDINNNFWNESGIGAIEYAHRIDGDGLRNGLTALGYSLTHKEGYTPFLKFNRENEPLNGENATYIKFPFSPRWLNAEYSYDPIDGKYYRSEFGAPHIDKNNNAQLAFENIVLLYIEVDAYENDDAGRLRIEFTGEGKGLYFNGGKYVEISWHRDNRDSALKLYNADGSELLLNTGKTVFEMYPNSKSDPRVNFAGSIQIK